MPSNFSIADMTTRSYKNWAEYRRLNARLLIYPNNDLLMWIRLFTNFVWLQHIVWIKLFLLFHIRSSISIPLSIKLNCLSNRFNSSFKTTKNQLPHFPSKKFHVCSRNPKSTRVCPGYRPINCSIINCLHKSCCERCLCSRPSTWTKTRMMDVQTCGPWVGIRLQHYLPNLTWHVKCPLSWSIICRWGHWTYLLPVLKWRSRRCSKRLFGDVIFWGHRKGGGENWRVNRNQQINGRLFGRNLTQSIRKLETIAWQLSPFHAFHNRRAEHSAWLE